MNRQELSKKVENTAHRLLAEKGYVSPVDLLMDLQILSLDKYEAWRRGQVPCLERVCHANLSRLSFVMKELRTFAKNNGLKASQTAYMKWGKEPKQRLKFSKSGSPSIEEGYATHYVAQKKTGVLA